MSTPSWSASVFASGSGRTLKPMITAPDAAASITSELRDAADAGVEHVQRRPAWCESFAIWSWIASSEPATSAFSTMLSATASPSLHALEDVLEADRRGPAPRERLGLQPDRALARRGGAPRGRSTTARTGSPASGHAVEAEHLDRLAGRRLLDAVAQEVVHRAHPAPVRAGDERVARPAACRAGRGRSRPGPRPGSSRDSITVPLAGASGFAFSSSTSATSRIMSSRLSRPSLVLADTSQKIVSPPHSSGVRPCAAELAAHALGLRALLVDLVDGDHHRHARPPSRGRSPRSSAASRRRRPRPRSPRCR